MQNINIEINQARILKFSVELTDKYPEIAATIGLFSGDKKLSDFTVGSRAYYNDVKIEVPIEIIEPLVEIAKQLEYAATIACSRSIGALPPAEVS